MIYISFLLVVYKLDFSQFAQFSSYTDKNRIPFLFNPVGETGYDGQFFIRLALNPFEINWAHENLPENNPSYRYSRIGYPIILWSFSFFLKDKIILVAQILNIFSILLIYILNKENLKLLKINDKYAIIFAFFPGYLFCIARLTPEIFEILFFSFLIFFYLKNNIKFFLISSFFLILIRETSLIFFFGMFCYFLYNKDPKIYLSIIPVLFYFVWVFVLYLIFNNIPLGTGVSVNFDLPFSGLFEMFRLPRYENNYLQGLTYITELIFLSFLVFYSLFKINFERNLFIILPFFLYLFYFVNLNEVVLGADWNFMRILLELYYFTILVIINNKNKNKYILLSLNFFFFIFCLLRICAEQFIIYVL